MTLTHAHPTTKTRPRRTALGLVFASVILGSTLTACGSGAGDTTCGELKDMSTDDVIELAKDAAEEEGDEDVQDTIDQVDDLGDTEKDAFAEALKAECEGEDDDTKLDDL